MPTTDIMIDLETLGTTPDSVIVSIAAVKFDPFEDYQERGVTSDQLPTLNILVDIDGQTDRRIDDNTVTWWSQQDPLIQETVFSPIGRVSFADALDQLHRFIWNTGGRVWAQGTQFDIAMLEHAYRSINKAYPWQYSQARDSRTLLDLVAVNLPKATHDAVADCWRQIIGVQQALATLGIQRFVR